MLWINTPWGGLHLDYQADLLVVDNLEKMTIQDVYYKGRKIDQDGAIIVKECPSELKNTVHVGEFSKEDLRLESPDGIFNVVGMQEGEITLSVKIVRYFMKWEYSPQMNSIRRLRWLKGTKQLEKQVSVL